MNDDKRKNARLQGRFSDEPKPPRKDKSKRKSDDGSSKRKSLEPKSLQPADGAELKFDEQANVSFPEFEEKKLPVEINKFGEHVLSETENGISRVIFEPDFIPEVEANSMMTLLNDSTKWHDKNIIIHGQEVPQPRLVAWYGPFPYAYSGAVLEAKDMPRAVIEIKERVERYLESHQLRVKLNSVLLNLYRDGKDSVAWHSDDEMTMGVSPTIASVSLGETRKFQMKIKPYVRESAKDLVSEEYFVNLTSGSLIVMDGAMQKDWKHQVPKEYHDRAPRINLTFRTVYPIDKVPVPLQVPQKIVENSNHTTSTKTDAKTHIFDNTNFPSLESANSQNGNSSKVPKNSSAKSKSKTVSKTEVKASLSNQSSSGDAVLPDSSYNSPASEDQKLKNVPTPNDGNVCASPNIDSHYQAEAVQDSNPNNECALAGSSELGHTVEDGNQFNKAHQLNANADEFIPKCPLPNNTNDEACSYYAQSEYHTQQMVKLPDLFRNDKVPPSRYNEFYSVLLDKLDSNPEFLSDRDHYEVETLTQLYENGLSQDNQRVVLSRLCSMFRNAARIKTRNSYRPPPPRSGYRSTYTRSRGSFKDSNNRSKD